ncbi:MULTISPECIES: hypothetical protein [unclassified Streptomyces]|uniref:hypothetical protein n=1 Tax=unclassified Streptomyces TaxID=2593676 RepID=UPI0033A07993
MSFRADVTSLANREVGPDARGVSAHAESGPVLATPMTVLVATAIPAVTATPTITQLGGYMPDMAAEMPELSAGAGLSADQLIAARLSA